MDAIQKKYENSAIRYSEMWLYFIRDAISVIRECESRNLSIHGLDAFRLYGKGIQPSMNNSLWFEGNSMDNYQKAIDHLLLPENEPYVFEIWYDGY